MAAIDISWLLETIPEHSDTLASLELLELCANRRIASDAYLFDQIEKRHGPGNPFSREWQWHAAPITAKMQEARLKIEARLERFLD